MFFSFNFRKLLEKLHDNENIAGVRTKLYSSYFEKQDNMSINQESDSNLTLEMSMDLREENDQNMTYTPGLFQVKSFLLNSLIILHVCYF